MSLIVPMIPALLALAGMTVALKAPHPAVRGLGAAAAVGVFAAATAVAVAYGYEEIAALFALAAAANVALGVATVREARRSRQPKPEPIRRPVLVDRRHDLGGHTITVEDGPDGATVVERSDGWLMKVVRTEGELARGETVFMVARAAASAYGAGYVSDWHATSWTSQHAVAVDNITGGAR